MASENASAPAQVVMQTEPQALEAPQSQDVTQTKDVDGMTKDDGGPRPDLIQTKDLAGCWVYLCLPCCMCTACIHKTATGPDTYEQKGCVWCCNVLPIPFSDTRNRTPGTNSFPKQGDEKNVNNFSAPNAGCNGCGCMKKIC